jgi:hypothetical protein
MFSRFADLSAVYTCQKSQPKRCDFFLWQDDAKVREESAVLSNSRSEPGQIPQTPKKPIFKAQAPMTPTSGGSAKAQERIIDLVKSPISRSGTLSLAHEDSFEWPSSDEAELAEAAAQTAMAPPVDTPRKTPRTERFTSPSKRSCTEMEGSGTTAWGASTPSNDGDVFKTPATSNRATGLLSPTSTPAQASSRFDNRDRPSSDDTFKSALAIEALKILAPIPLNSTVESQLVTLLNKHDLRTQGIAKGRDITRLAIQSKDKRIAELQARIAGLETERETSRTVIAHLKQDIGTNSSSPKKRRGGFAARNSSPAKT